MATKSDIDDIMREDSRKRKPSQDRLEEVREAAKRLRDLALSAASLEERLKQIREQKRNIEMQELPDLFDTAGVTSITLAAEGNLPEYTCKVSPYYHANIRADWPPQKKEAAFTWLRDHGSGDLIKQVFTIELGMGMDKQAKAIQAALNKLKVKYNQEQSVPWNTLTSFVKEQIEKHQETPPLETLGATVGRIAKIKANN